MLLKSYPQAARGGQLTGPSYDTVYLQGQPEHHAP